MLPPLSYRFRTNALMWLRRAVLLVLPAAVWYGLQPAWLFAMFITTLLLLYAGLPHWELSPRRQFIREAQLPSIVADKLRAAHPQLQPHDADLALYGLCQFFIEHLRCRRKSVAMPSKIADAAWYEFILHTCTYGVWCHTAFSHLLHHSPAEMLGKDLRRNDGLRRSWCWACKDESIDPRKPSRLPLLFALDKKFAVPGGFSYLSDRRSIRQRCLLRHKLR